jgi:hypothetical protein
VTAPASASTASSSTSAAEAATPAADVVDEAPVTPCAPAVAAAFIADRFGPRAAASLDPAARTGAVRAARITELRRAGRLREAERYGWLSLTGWLLGLSAADLSRLNPQSDAFQRRAGRRDLLPVPLGEDFPPKSASAGGTDLQITDPRDRLGWMVLSLGAGALAGRTADLGGRRVAAGAVLAALRIRLEACRG